MAVQWDTLHRPTSEACKAQWGDSRVSLDVALDAGIMNGS
jgi:hypothetical protein